MISRERLAQANKRALRRFRAYHGSRPERYRRVAINDDAAWVRATLGALRKLTCACSGPCCGNPRKWFGQRTIQERRAMQEAA